MNILEVSDLRKSFGKAEIIKGISFALGEGEILGILGPNGAGKTTTIQMLIGALTPTSGTIKIFDKDLSSDREYIAERLNFSSTYTRLPWWLTVRENLTWSSYLYDITARPKRIDKVKTMFRLEELWDQKMYQLSAGQLTRVNIARSCLNFPKVLVLDEPTASLDPEVAEYIHGFLKRERGEFNTSVIITSHNMAEVEELCDRVIVLKDGKIVATDTPSGLAREVTISHLTVRLNNSAKAKKWLQTHKYNHVLRDSILTINTHESKIPEIISDLAQAELTYTEISIDKPSLQDFFLQVAKSKKVQNEMA